MIAPELVWSIMVALMLFSAAWGPVNASEYDVYFVPAGSADGPYGGGYPPDTCARPAVMGRTPEDVGRKAVAANNAVTGSQCYGVCRNPSRYVTSTSAYYEAQSLCTGWRNTQTIISIENPKNLGRPRCGLSTRNPIHIGTGNKFLQQIDVQSTPGALLRFERYYNSRSFALQQIGQHWSRSYSQKILLTTDTATVYRPDGAQFFFVRAETGWAPDADVHGELSEHRDVDGITTLGWTYQHGDVTESFDGQGRLTEIRHASGRLQTLVYSADALIRIEDDAGRWLAFAYDIIGRISTITDSADRQWHYQYGDTGNLITVQNPDGSSRGYHYEDTRYPHALTGITDERGVRFATYSYDENQLASVSELANGVERVSVTYSPDGSRHTVDSRGYQKDYETLRALGTALPATSAGVCGTCAQ